MNKVVLITGSRKGIGKYLCDYYLEKGFTVIGCSRGEASIKHKNYSHYLLNVGDEKPVVRMIKEVVRMHKKIDVLINNAGIASMNHFALTPLKTVTAVFDTNFLGTFLFMREVSKVMMNQKTGRIVNFTSVAVPLNLEGEAIYASSKAAIEQLTRVTASELGKLGITVNAIGFTPVQTDLIKGVPKEKMDGLLNRQAVKRFGSLNDVAHAVDFFIDDKSDFITGQVMYLGGIS